MRIDGLIARLDGVRETGPGRLVACCPAHDDRSPSLSIRETDDGRILLHCFAGCEVESVLDALGMTFADVMPERIGTDHAYKSRRPRFDARQVLEGVSYELTVVALIAEKMAQGDPLTDEYNDRLTLAAQRMNTAMEAAAPLRTPPEIRALRSPSR